MSTETKSPKKLLQMSTIWATKQLGSCFSWIQNGKLCIELQITTQVYKAGRLNFACVIDAGPLQDHLVFQNSSQLNVYVGF